MAAQALTTDIDRYSAAIVELKTLEANILINEEIYVVVPREAISEFVFEFFN